uniref:Uncharacterized protein n=1 Tax=Nelumbo nucifera TaxID=4432 RepID=A0A822YKX9_NELNU|nr:TPA_asm: hypothetical protein HUJ06_010486 [Nelumbo nucifera]
MKVLLLNKVYVVNVVGIVLSSSVLQFIVYCICLKDEIRSCKMFIHKFPMLLILFYLFLVTYVARFDEGVQFSRTYSQLFVILASCYNFMWTKLD